MKGVCGAWMNAAYDYAISNNKWAVVFRDARGETLDLLTEFTVTVWIKYVSLMVCRRSLIVDVH